VEEFKVKQEAKFKCKTKVKFSASAGGPVFASLKVKAKGKARTDESGFVVQLKESVA
jgi:hypothetical protein